MAIANETATIPKLAEPAAIPLIPIAVAIPTELIGETMRIAKNSIKFH